MKSPFLLLSLVLFTLSASAGEKALDGYGGWKDINGESTGWFRIGKAGDRSLIFTPEGHGFLALGINHIGSIAAPGNGQPDLFADRYGGDLHALAEAVSAQYADWGLNTVDDAVAPLTRSLPYLVSNNLVKTAKYYGGPGESHPYDFPDVFDPAFAEYIDTEVARICSRHRGARNLIAYYWTDTPTWDIRKTRIFRRTDWVSEIRRLARDSPGFGRYVGFLTDRYRDDISAFNRAYGMERGSFQDLSPEDFEAIDLQRYEVERDDEEFLGIIAETYYGIVGPAFRLYDPNHMVFGEKYLLGDIPRRVLEAAAPHLDAIAIQPGDGYLPIYTPGDIWPSEEVEEIHRLTGKPVFICDHQISFPTEEYPKSIWPYHQRTDEADAAAATATFLREAFATPYVLGYMRCQYIDRYSDRRAASKLGLLRADGTEYEILVRATREAIAEVKASVRKVAGVE